MKRETAKTGKEHTGVSEARSAGPNLSADVNERSGSIPTSLPAADIPNFTIEFIRSQGWDFELWTKFRKGFCLSDWNKEELFREAARLGYKIGLKEATKTK